MLLEYLMAELARVEGVRKAYRSTRRGYSWDREYTALHTAVYVLRLLLEHEKDVLRTTRADLAQRGFSTERDIDRLGREA